MVGTAHRIYLTIVLLLLLLLLSVSRTCAESIQAEILYTNDGVEAPETIYVHSTSIRLHCVVRSSNLPGGITASWQRRDVEPPIARTIRGDLYRNDLVLTVTTSGIHKCVAMQNDVPRGTVRTVNVVFVTTDSRWEAWSAWQCTCSTRQRTRRRLCHGNDCKGEHVQYDTCSKKDCRHALARRSLASSSPPHQSSDPSNLVIVVAVCSALIGLLLCVAIIACWRRLHLEQRQARQRQEEENAARAMLLSMTDYDSGVSADDYPDDPELRQMAGPIPLGVSFPHAPASFAEALQGPAPPPNPFFGNAIPATEERNNQLPVETNAGDEEESPPAPDEDYAHLKEGMTEDEMPPVASANDTGDGGDVPPASIL